ncbi:MAG TPA: pantothenate kinase, partial [bacterium]|nr:pantothenate kinase [bacterium]
MNIGIDLGNTATKIACLTDGRPCRQQTLTGHERGIAAALTAARTLAGTGVGRVAVTGVGSVTRQEELADDAQLTVVNEFDAIGAGGLIVSGLPAALVVSVGTGTALVHADGATCRHLGGSGVGGGALLGMARAMLGVSDAAQLVAMAADGSLANVDLTVGEVLQGAVPGLDADLTVANLGKAGRDSKPADVAAGIINLVIQTIGVLAAYAAKAEQVGDIVVAGRLATAPQACGIFARLGALHRV